jgi:hypothetical protein
MIDTRREMTRAQFADAAAFAYESSLLTGEESFLHVPAVMQVEGWNIYGHSGNNQLTEPQRVLMMWSDLVGQASNGGFTQFIDNYSSALALAHRLIAKLEWPELFERFDLAFREQVGDPLNPKPRQEPWGPDDDAACAARRELMIDRLALQKTRWRPWARRRERAFFERLSDLMLDRWYNDAVESGEIAADDEPATDYEEGPTEAADAFDDWFYRDETKAASRIFIGDYIKRHRDDLCRLSD